MNDSEIKCPRWKFKRLPCLHAKCVWNTKLTIRLQVCWLYRNSFLSLQLYQRPAFILQSRLYDEINWNTKVWCTAFSSAPQTMHGSVVRRPNNAIHWIAIFSTFVKLAVDLYNLRLRLGIYKLKFLRSIVGSRSVVSQHFGEFYECCIIRYPLDGLSGLRTTCPWATTIMAKNTGTARKKHYDFQSAPSSPLNVEIVLPFSVVCVATYSTNYI